MTMAQLGPASQLSIQILQIHAYIHNASALLSFTQLAAWQMAYKWPALLDVDGRVQLLLFVFDKNTTD